MNLGELRNAVFSQADWAPTQSTDAVSRANDFINRAYFQMAQEAPFLFFENRTLFATLSDSIPTAVGDTLHVLANDPWVLQRDLPVGGTVVGWDSTGRWGARVLRVTDANGRIHHHRIRAIWDDAVTARQRVSLMRPWHNITDTGLVWHIYSEEYLLPDDVIEVNSIRLAESNQNWPLDIIGQLEAEKLSLADSPDQIPGGLPRVAFRRGHKQIDSPTLAPVLTLAPGGDDVGAIPWEGPDPAGQFEYVYTYYWGTRDDEVQAFGPQGSMAADQSVSARLEPLMESAPSPATSITAVNSNLVTGAIQIQTPDIALMQGFGRGTAGGADPRFHHSGWRKRIYRRRITVDTDAASYGALLYQELGALTQETPDTFFLMFDVPAYETTTIDNGNILPDYHRRLRDVHGYQTLRFYPRPAARYEVDIRCIQRPAELRDDQDVPRIHRDAMDVLIHKALGLLYEAQGNLPLADRALGRYQQDLITLTKRYGDLRYPGEPILKRPARASHVVDTRRPWRRWYNLP